MADIRGDSSGFAAVALSICWVEIFGVLFQGRWVGWGRAVAIRDLVLRHEEATVCRFRIGWGHRGVGDSVLFVQGDCDAAQLDDHGGEVIFWR